MSAVSGPPRSLYVPSQLERVTLGTDANICVELHGSRFPNAAQACQRTLDLRIASHTLHVVGGDGGGGGGGGGGRAS